MMRGLCIAFLLALVVPLAAVLIGLAPAGHGLKWRSIAAAAAVAMIGPTTWDAVRVAPPSRWLAAAVAVLFVLALFKMGNGENYEFIYFQF